MPQMPQMPQSLLLHASCVAKQDQNGAYHGILLRGAPGAGKSDLSLRLIAAGWQLVADDQTIIAPNVTDAAPHCAREKAAIIARCPPAIRGLIEMRGVGLIKMESVESAQIDCIFDLLPHEKIERYPDSEQIFDRFFGIALRKYQLCGFSASAPDKIEIILKNYVII